MITWKNLVKAIEKLEELPNGVGSEIGFSYQGNDYIIICYEDSYDLQRCWETIEDSSDYYMYRTLSELGKAKDIGFSVEECWESFEAVSIKPNFDKFTLEEIYAGYERRLKNGQKPQNIDS